jgi:autotransporter passenger strand-loop-strand repeat protein
MGRFVYFIEQAAAASADTIAKAGLQDVLSGGPVTSAMVGSGGPGGGGGIYVASGDGVISTSALSGWKPRGEGVWIGLDGDMPSESELRRQDIVRGVGVTLADGEPWEVPVGRLCLSPGETSLPQRFGLGDDGSTVREVAPAYARLWELAGDVFQALVGLPIDGEDASQQEEPEGISFERGVDIAADVLGVNYRVGRAELLMAGVLDTSSVRAVLYAFSDAQTYEELTLQVDEAKKKAGDGGGDGDESCIDSGETDS